MLKDLKRAMVDDSGRFIKESLELIGTRKMDTQDLARLNELADEHENDIHDEYDNDFDDSDNDGYEEDEHDEYDDELTDPEHERDLDKQSERRIIMAAIATGVAIIILITSIGLWLYGGRADAPPIESYVPDESEVHTMPTLSGMNIDAARAILEEMGLVIGSVEEVYDDTLPEGVIIEYYPQQGAEMDYGDEVDVVISRGSDRVMIPDATGELLENVILMREFAENIFFYEEIQIFDDDLPIGVIVSQEPAAGTYATRGQTIRFEVSMGREVRRVTVPLLLGETEEVAKTRLEEAGLRIGQVAAAYNADFPAGQVSMQNFPGGVEVTEGTVITFVVSLGPRQGGTQPPGGQTPPDDPNQGLPPLIQARTETISIPAPMDALALGPAQVRVDKVSNGVTERVHDGLGLLIGDFPRSVTVSGIGNFEVRVYVNGQLRTSQAFN